MWLCMTGAQEQQARATAAEGPATADRPRFCRFQIAESLTPLRQSGIVNHSRSWLSS